MSQLKVFWKYIWAMIGIIIISTWAGCGVAQYGEPVSRLGEYRYIYRQYHPADVRREIPIWVDKNFSDIDLLSIEKAVNQWNYVLNGYIELKIVDINFDMEVDKIQEQENLEGWLFMKIGSGSKIIPEDNDPKYHTIGFVEAIGGHHLYLVRDRIGSEAVFGVTMHEIGHLLGSPHVGNHLMYPYYSIAGYQCIDWDSVHQVAEYQGLPIGKLNYCVDLNEETKMGEMGTMSKCAN